MIEKKPKVIAFITGTSGAGKSVLVPLLKKRLPNFEVHDFDEVGVPEDVDLSWRLKTTNYWLEIAKKNLANAKSTIISGSTVPDEILASPECDSSLKIYFGLLKINKSTIQERLMKRGWTQESIDAYKIWQPQLITAVEKQKNHRIIDGEQEKENIVEDIVHWLQS